VVFLILRLHLNSELQNLHC